MLLIGGNYVDYDVAADGRFLMTKARERESLTDRIHIIRDWVEELKRVVPRSQ